MMWPEFFGFNNIKLTIDGRLIRELTMKPKGLKGFQTRKNNSEAQCVS